jgi:hypothetical protein
MGRLKLELQVPTTTVWSPPRGRAGPLCSVCFGGLPVVPLRVWRDDGACVILCSDCADKCLKRVE